MAKNLTVDFFQVLIRNSSSSIPDFKDIIQKTINIPADKRAREVRLHHVYLYEAAYGWQDTWEGEIVQLRMDNIPVKGDLSGKIEDLQLGTDEGIGEQSAFIYHPASKILALQTNRHGVSPGSFAQYFEFIAEGNIEISLLPVLQIDAMQRLEKLKDVKKFEINVAGINNIESIFNSGNNGVGEIIELSNAFQSPSIALELKASNSKSNPIYLIKEKVVGAAQSLARISKTNQNNAKVSKIRITGASDDEDNILVDLLKDRMREKISIGYSGKNRNIPYNYRKTALQTAWNKRLDEITKMYV